MATKKSFTLKSSQVHLFSYLTGLLTAILIFSLFSLFIGYKIGFSNFFPQPAIVLPQDILNELTQLKAPMDNAKNPTKVNKHDTFLVRPDKELGYVLRPDIRISVSMLKSARVINVDPPVLHLNTDVQYSDRLKTYLKKESRVDYIYSTDGKGFRKTVPNVKSDKQILIIGDSVAFGVGVDDENTGASHLQKLIGEQYQIINADVGGYTGQQVFLMAKRLSDEKKFSGLIYIACQNDFMDGKDWVVEAKDILAKISTLSNNSLMPQGAIILAFSGPGVLADRRNGFRRFGLDRARDFDPERPAHQVGDVAAAFEPNLEFAPTNVPVFPSLHSRASGSPGVLWGALIAQKSEYSQRMLPLSDGGICR